MTIKPNHSRRLQRWVHYSLLLGLATSSALLVIGLLATAFGAPQQPSDNPQPLGALVQSAARGEGQALLTLGILALMATPIVRVAVLAGGWFVQGDGRFAAVAATVLALLAFSLVLGLG